MSRDLGVQVDQRCAVVHGSAPLLDQRQPCFHVWARSGLAERLDQKRAQQAEERLLVVQQRHVVETAELVQA